MNKWIFVLILVVLSIILYLIGFLDYELAAWKQPDFRLGVLAEIHGVLIEAFFIVGLLSYITKRRENKEWRPTRLLVARHICRLHQNLLNSLRFTVDINYHTDLKGHSFPEYFTQHQADAWGREHQINWLDTPYNELTQMVEYNNVALNSSFQPLIISYIVNAKTILSMLKFTLTAYQNPTVKHAGSFNYVGLLEMETIYKKMLKDFPEIAELEKPSTGRVLTSKEILKFVEKSNSQCEFLDLRIIR